MVNYIKRHSPGAKILFGGPYSQFRFEEVFERYDVDYFIKGYNEVPMQLLLNGQDPKTIPNMVGRGFRNPTTYVFREKDYEDIQFDLDWFPGYFKSWKSSHWQPQGGRYHIPMIVTSRGGSVAAHEGCEYCMGSRMTEFGDIYHGKAVVIGNETLISLLRKIESNFKQGTLFVNSDCSYDLSGEFFDLDMTIEIDSEASVADVKRLLPAFREATFHIAVYQEGLTGQSVEQNLDEFLSLGDEHHRFFFFAYEADAEALNIPPEKNIYADGVLPDWASWDFYMNTDNAMRISKEWYRSARQFNPYPTCRKPFAVLEAYAWLVRDDPTRIPRWLRRKLGSDK